MAAETDGNTGGTILIMEILKFRPIGHYEQHETARHGTVSPRRVLLARQRVKWENVTDEQFKKALEVVKRTLARRPEWKR